MKPANEALNDKVRRFAEAFKQLLEEGYSIRDFRGVLEAAPDRAGVEGRSRSARIECPF